MFDRLQVLVCGFGHQRKCFGVTNGLERKINIEQGPIEMFRRGGFDVGNLLDGGAPEPRACAACSAICCGRPERKARKIAGGSGGAARKIPSRAAVLARQARLPKPEFQEDLPVNERRAEIAELIAKNQVVIVCGETGSGKTTQLPKICLELGAARAG
jgi:hypothetical protein